MKLIIAGSRTFTDYRALAREAGRAVLGQKVVVVLCGEAAGADALGKQWALESGWPVVSYPADWEGLGRSAGFVRNRQMVSQATHLLAFWDGKSKGTAHVIMEARRARLDVRVFRFKLGA